jgi:hypothetical protein
MSRYSWWKDKLRLMRQNDGRYMIVQEKRDGSSHRIQAKDLPDRETALRRMRNISKETGIR